MDESEPSLPQLKKERPWYKDIYSQVLQDCVKRVNGKYVENGQTRQAGLNKSFSDCAISQFVEILQHQARKLGVKIVKLNPKNTSQICWKCLNKVPKTLSDRWHDCSICNESIDRDLNSSKLLLKLGLGIVSV